MHLPEAESEAETVEGVDRRTAGLYHESVLPAAGTIVDAAEVILISPYELGRQPFGLAEPAAWLAEAGVSTACLDLSLEKLADTEFCAARMIGLYLGMHTATRIAVEAIAKIRERAPDAHLFAYGLYAPVNEEYLRTLGVSHIFGGESEPDIVALAMSVLAGERPVQESAVVRLDKIAFQRPHRENLPALTRYAHLVLPNDQSRVVGHVEATRGCKHVCRHCPVVPVYQGRFRVVPLGVVLDDIEQQVEAGAEHISFGDPDFLNGPTHAIKILREMRNRWPQLTFDATVKVEHILQQPDAMQMLADSGCLFLTSAVESVEDPILALLEKNHTAADFEQAVIRMLELNIALAPTFVAFTPWTTMAGYIALLKTLVNLRLVQAVPPIQLAIRLLVPAGSRLLELEAMQRHIGPFEQTLLGYPWVHPDPRMDELQRMIQDAVEQGERDDEPRDALFRRIWVLTHETAGQPVPALPTDLGVPIPAHSEPWYCCAEPTDAQLSSL
ncbi:MAG: CUAEP/CCAEP-tail radical SAM protein [Pseudomonadota bacterium]